MVRFKNRYFLVEIKLQDDEIVDGLSMYSVLQAVLDSIAEMYGEYGLILGAGVQVKYYSPYTGMAIIRSSREFHKSIWVALTFITKVKGRAASFRVVHLSGTIKMVESATIKYDRKQIEKLKHLGIITESKAKILINSSTLQLSNINS